MAMPVVFVDGDTGGTPLSANNLNSNFNYLDSGLSDVATTSESLTLLTSGWTLNSGTNLYEYEITNANVTTDHKVDITMDITNQEKLSGSAYTQTFTGSYKIYTTELPAESISCTAYITKVGD